MTSHGIRTRTTRNGARRFLVWFRLGGRGFPVIYAGTFATKREAQLRRDMVAGEIAAGRDPRILLADIAKPREVRSVRSWWDGFVESRIDLSPARLNSIRGAGHRIVPLLEDTDLTTLTPTRVQEIIGRLVADGLSPATVTVYVTILRQVLDFAGVEPNPARHRTVKLPRVARDEPAPPPAEHVLAILQHVRNPQARLAIVVLEQTAMRAGELDSLTWADVDITGNRFRLRSEGTKTRRARWVQVPEWLMGVLLDATPPDDRAPERRVFPGLSTRHLRAVIRRACVNAEIPLYSPHDLRHRRASLWHGQGIPGRELATRLGHANPSMSLDVYSHVMPTEETSPDDLARLVRTP